MKALQDLRGILVAIAQDVEVLPAMGEAIAGLGWDGIARRFGEMRRRWQND